MHKINDDEGVSAIIGVMLITLTTVLLAALIAQFCFTLTDGMPRQHLVGIIVERSGCNIIYVQTIGGDLRHINTGDAEHHNRAAATYTCTVNGVAVNPVSSTGVEIPDGTGNFDASAIGDRMYFLASPGDEVIITAQFVDDSYMTVYSGRIP